MYYAANSALLWLYAALGAQDSALGRALIDLVVFPLLGAVLVVLCVPLAAGFVAYGIAGVVLAAWNALLECVRGKRAAAATEKNPGEDGKNSGGGIKRYEYEQKLAEEGDMGCRLPETDAQFAV